MKKAKSLSSIFIALILLQSCSKMPDSTKKQVSILNKNFAFEIGIYFANDSIGINTVKKKALEMLPDFKLVTEIPDSIIADGFMLNRYNDLTKDYTPPDTSYLRFSGVGLSIREKIELANSKNAIVISFLGTYDKILDKQKKIANLISSLTSDKSLFIGDYTALSFFSPDSWKRKRVDPFTGSNILNHIMLHTYREEELCRIVSLGMGKFCLPDVSVKDIPCSDANTYGTLVNALIATLIENPIISVDSTLTIDLQNISDLKLKEAVSSDIKDHARRKAVVRLKFVKPEQGDDINNQLQIVFEDKSFASPQEEQNKIVADLFGYEESYEHTVHDDELLQASFRAKARLPELMTIFNKGLEPGHSLLLKLPFKTDSGGREWMWVEVTKWRGDLIEGILQNEPYEVSNLKTGAKVTASQQDVFDYILNKADGTMEGNETGEIIDKRN